MDLHKEKANKNQPQICAYLLKHPPNIFFY